MSTLDRKARRPDGRRGIVGTAVIGVGGAIAGAVAGLIVGANVGGNWMTAVSFAGQRGYEATGLIGAVVGAVVLGGLSIWLARRR